MVTAVYGFLELGSGMFFFTSFFTDII